MDFPGFDETSSDAGSPVPAEGWHHVTLSDMEFATSKSGNEMLVAQLVIDAGPDAHKELTEYMVMGMDLGEARLKAFSENARSKNHQDGFRWSQDVNSWEAFASQFVTDPRLRFQVKVEQQQAADQTVKALFELPSGREAETVLIPAIDERGEARRLTVCVSSEVGCAMGCEFCATGLMGFRENLTPGAIFDQVWHMNEVAQERFGRPVTNVVFMGMGEPLLNYDAVLSSIDILTDEDSLNLSAQKITVSTVGLARRIKDLADDRLRANLAVSLHAPDNETRSRIMPVNEAEKTSLPALKEAIQYYSRKTGRPVTYEYCLFKGVNDSEADARNLAEVARWAPSKVNLLMYNPVEGLNFERTSEAQLDRFVQVLVEEGITVTVRRSRGQDIDAACGQLANDEG